VTSDPYRICITGSRAWTDTAIIRNALLAAAARRQRVIIAHGDARGADRIAAAIALSLGYQTRAYPARWRNTDGTRNWGAGFERNTRMLDDFKPHIVLAFHQDNSNGTADTIRKARERNIPVHVHEQRRPDLPMPPRPSPGIGEPRPPIGLSIAAMIPPAVPNKADMTGALTIELFPRSDRPG
jgi:hypothetical protein